MSEQESYKVTSERVRKVFQDAPIVKQQEASFLRLMDRALERNAPNPVPEIEIEGIKEVLENLWHPELTRQLSKSKD